MYIYVYTLYVTQKNFYNANPSGVLKFVLSNTHLIFHCDLHTQQIPKALLTVIIGPISFCAHKMKITIKLYVSAIRSENTFNSVPKHRQQIKVNLDLD